MPNKSDNKRNTGEVIIHGNMPNKQDSNSNRRNVYDSAEHVVESTKPMQSTRLEKPEK